jgi:hypothetical protein
MVKDVERCCGVSWNELADLEPELDRLLRRVQREAGGIRSWREVAQTFAVIRSEMADMVGFSGKHWRHPVLGTAEAYDVAHWKLYAAVAGPFRRANMTAGGVSQHGRVGA